MNPYDPIPMSRVRISDHFWGARQKVNFSRSLSKQYEQCDQTGRIDALLLKWKEGQPNKPHIFWDSDTAKWLEAACYAYQITKDAELFKKIDHVAERFIGAQQPDGYINSYFTVVAPERRWKNLRDDHELYCAGHLFEAAVVHHEATGDDKLLKAACRFADYIDSVFGTGEGKIPGYCGHEEIELALVRLYHATGNKRYLDLSAYFVNQRGQKPHYFEQEGNVGKGYYTGWNYFQCHLPVREQKEATGHAVRATYLYSAMADLARELNDPTLLDACRNLWRSAVDRKSYITGGVGSLRHGEAFGNDYDLPNETAYCETCASVAMVLWAQRMLRIDLNGEYGDMIEREIYNGALSGMSLDGEKFFYENPLASRGNHHRKDWFECCCCPSNLSRLVASIGGYVYTQRGTELIVHQYIGGEAGINLGGGIGGAIRQEGDYPWEGNAKITLDVSGGKAWSLKLRIPAWATKHEVLINGAAFSGEIQNGYLTVTREWKSGDVVELHFPMEIRRLVSHPQIVCNAGQVALQRGPFIYCIEDADFEVSVSEVALPKDAKLAARVDKSFLQPLVVIEGEGEARQEDKSNEPYRTAKLQTKRIPFRAIPYFAWDNRREGSMRVWIPIAAE